MRVKVILDNGGGELDRKDISVSDNAQDLQEVLSLAIHEAIDKWVLSPGDTIRIEEI